MWVGRHKLNNSLVVFIHGFTGDPWGTWKHIVGRLQEGFPTDPLLRSYDLYSFQYDSSWWRQPDLRPYVVDRLDTFLQRHQADYDTIALVGHSQGGLVAKLYVIELLTAGRGLQLKVDLVITFGTPHLGIRVLDLFRWLPRVPVIGPRLPRQFFGLGSVSANIKRLKEHWAAPYITTEGTPPSADSRAIRSIAVAGAYDWVVGTKSASGFAADIHRFRSAAHPIVRSVGELEEVAGFIEDELKKLHAPPQLLDRIDEIRSINANLEAYVQANEAWVAGRVGARRPALSSRGREIKTASLLLDFLTDFPRRPLRALELEQALRTYVERQLDDRG